MATYKRLTKSVLNQTFASESEFKTEMENYPSFDNKLEKLARSYCKIFRFRACDWAYELAYTNACISLFDYATNTITPSNFIELFESSLEGMLSAKTITEVTPGGDWY